MTEEVFELGEKGRLGSKLGTAFDAALLCPRRCWRRVRISGLISGTMNESDLICSNSFYRTRVRSMAKKMQLKTLVVTVANVDDEDCIGNSLLQIWELRIVHKAKLLFRL